MSIRKSNFRPEVVSGNESGSAKSSSKSVKRRLAQRATARVKKDRRSLLEALEQRQLLAGPNLVGIQPNQGALLFDGAELNSSPRELVFRFDDSTQIDPDTLGAIRITRAGSDSVFESAIATSDLGTGNQVLLEFRAVQAGTAGEGLRVNFTSSSRVGSGVPLITVNDRLISIDLNNNPARPTQVRDLISAVANHPTASGLLQVFSVSGATLFPLGTTVPTGTSVTLRGANAADATSDLGTGGEVRVRFISARPGPDGRATTLVLERANAGGPANPLVLVDGNRVTVRVNSNPGNETSVNALINAINSNPEASTLITAVLEAGSAATLVGNRVNFPGTILLTGANDIVVEPGYVGIGNSPNEVVFRFAETLAADTYQIDIFGSGTSVLANVDGEVFNNGENFGRQFRVNLGPKVAAVVPEPIRRQGNGALSPEVGVIDVHFDETMDGASVTNVNFYQLIFTRDSASTLDDVTIRPTSVSYNQSTNVAKLTFAAPLARTPNPSGVGFLTGAARLRIGNAQTNPVAAPTTVPVFTEPGDSFATAFGDLNDLAAIDSSGIRSVRLQGEIRNTTDFGLQFPGGPGAEGVRQIRPEDPSRVDRPIPLDFFRQGADSVNGITTIQYEFPSSFRGDDPNIAGEEIDNLKTYFNLITAQQRQRVREVLSLFSEYLGVQFVEVTNGPTSDAFFSIVVGDLYGADMSTVSGPGGLAVATRDRTGDGVNDLVVMDFQDFQQSTDDQFGGPFFRGAMLAIGQVIGFGFADSLPQPVTQSSDFIFNPGTTNEPTFPSVSDIINGQFLYRPDSTDIDLYRFRLGVDSKVSIQTIAERLSNASLLDTHLRLYRKDGATGAMIEIAQNNDYFSNDSLIELDLSAGEYVIGVSAAGNDQYNPSVPGSGLGGLTEGAYELRISTKAVSAAGIRDSSGVLLDGDSDGKPGGIYDFWFVPADQSNTLYVDKAALSNGNGSVAQPFRNLNTAIAAATPGTTIRMVANGGTDGRVETKNDNFSYQIGFSPTGTPLQDGTSLDVPRGVRLLIDAGVIIKMRQARIGVGSTSPTVDRSDAAIQILGTPILLGADGLVARDQFGEAIPGSVVITSINDRTIGNGNVTGVVPVPQPGDWGGIDLRSDIDFANSTRRNRENEGVFLNHIQFADLRYGGGQVRVDGPSVVISPVDMALTRATVTNSIIRLSADAAIAATPDTFRETRYDEALFQLDAPFTPTVMRVGPDIHGNTVIDNSINGLFIRVATRTGGVLQPLTQPARFDDTDIVHVLSENLVIQGNPGGALAPAQAPSSLLVQGIGQAGGGDVAIGSYVYRIAFSSATTESAASTTTPPIELLQTGRIQLTQLPIVAAGSGFTGRRIYRASVAADGTFGNFALVGSLNATDTTFTDALAAGTTPLPAQTLRLTARTDARLAVDPGTIVKLGGARIDITFGADLIAEGTASDPVIFTSLQDQRYGAGGTFDTNSVANAGAIQAGDWGGIYVGHTSSASIDHAVIAGGGGATRIPGGFASFNAIEVHQAELRLTNSRFEMNADGRRFIDGNQLDRAGRGENASGTVFVRGAQPIVVKNDFIGGSGPVLTFDVNSLTWEQQIDRGRSTGFVDSVIATGNSGPLVSGNRLENNSLNGMEIRGGQVATEVVWDDVDMVHIVRGMIEVPNHHVYGGLRLASDARGSLVVKFENTAPVAGTLTTPAIAGRTAGIVVGGNLTTAADQFVDIADRIGGSLQVIGHPDFPVVLTALRDDSIGAGFTPSGRPNVDTNNDGIRPLVEFVDGSLEDDEIPPLLPLGPEWDRTDREVNNGPLIDNDIDPNVVGFFQADILNGGEVTNISVSGIEMSTGTRLDQQNFAFLNTTLIDIDYVPLTPLAIAPARAPIRLSNSTIVQPPTLISPDRVQSTGTIDLLEVGDAILEWTAETFFVNNRSVMYTTITFSTSDGADFGVGRNASVFAVSSINVINLLDFDVPPAANDERLFLLGTPGTRDFRAVVLDQPTRVGFSHGGIYTSDNVNMFNASFDGWSADAPARLQAGITNETRTFTPDGVIDVLLPTIPGSGFSNSSDARGPGNISTAFSWSLDVANDRARTTSFVEWLPSDPANPFQVQLPPSLAGSGSWNGIVIREAANDRNVAVVTEIESRTNSRFDSNSVPSESQFLGELAPNEGAGDENRRLGFVVNGSILSPDDVDVFSFVAEAGTQVWLDIDRTQLALNSILELIDANGLPLVLSDSSLLESRGDLARMGVTGAGFEASNARSLNVLPIAAGSPTSAYQDAYSINPNDPGMRVILPGSPGQRNLYHVRVRSSNVTGADRSTLLEPNLVRAGTSAGNYQLQIRLREADETPGTQVRHSDVRFATNGIQIIGGPINGPLVGDVSETIADNSTIATAQPMGLFEISINQSLNEIAGPLSSNRMSKSIAGFISGQTDVDWFQFDVNYQKLTRDAASMFFATIFDIDYADGFARGDLAVYVFNEQGEMILIGTDSNVADDQPTGLDGTSNNDLSRGSAGTLDPFIGVAELPEGRYFVAISNQSQIPVQMDQFALAAATNPLFRLEPIDSVRRIAEDRIGGVERSVGSAPVIPTLFDPATSVVPYTLNDVMLYTISGGTVNINNPFTGQGYGNIGFLNTSFQDFAFRANGELFGYTTPGTVAAADFDASYAYFRINSENGALTNVGTSGLETYHLAVNPNPQNLPFDAFVVVRSNDSFAVQGTTFASNTLGFAIGNRPIDRQLTPTRIQNAYFQNILYAFSPTTGAFSGLGSPNRGTFTVNGVTIDERANGAGTQIRERGYIETGVGEDVNGIPRPQTSPQLTVPAATIVQTDGVTIPRIADGSFFTLQSGAQSFRFELDAGTMLEFSVDPVNGSFPREVVGGGTPARFSLTSGGVTTNYEFDSGPVIVIDAAQVVDGTNVRITDVNGNALVFEFNSNGIVNNAGAVGVDFMVGQTSDQLALALAAAISDSSLMVEGFATPGQGRVDMVGDSTTVAPQIVGPGLSISGAAGSSTPSDPSIVLIPIRENFTANELAFAVANATGGAVAGNRVNYRNVSATNLTQLTPLGIVTQTGTPGVSPGSTAVTFLVTDTAEAIALRISQVVNANPTLQASGITVTVNGRNLIFENALLNAANGTVSPAFTVAGVPPGGIVTGISMVGPTLYAVSSNGGLYAVAAPTATVQGQIGTYIGTATDLIGLNFTGLTTGPTNIPGLLDDAGNPLLFGTTSGGLGGSRLYAFDTQGRLRPVFAGGATSVTIAPGVRGVEFSTLDFNLWHTTERRGTDLGHGIDVAYNDVALQPNRVAGGTSFYFGAEPLDPRFDLFGNRNPFSIGRQDGQGVEGTYNFPGGAKGALESAAFDLVGYSPSDLPTLYFNYFLANDGVDGVIGSDNDGTFGRDQDAFRVYVIDERGVQHLLSTNNLVTAPGAGFNDEFDDPTASLNPLLAQTYDDDITVAVQPMFDNTDSWRQARVSLADFAGQRNLQLRLEFATSGSFSDGSFGLRAVPGMSLVDGARFVVGGRSFEIDLGSTLTVPAGSTIANFYALNAGNPLQRVTVVVGGVTYVLNDGTRTVNAGEVDVQLVQQGDRPLSTFTAELVATRLAAAITVNGISTITQPFSFTAEPNDELLNAIRMPSFTGNVVFSGQGTLQTGLDVDLYRIDLPAGATLRATMSPDGVSFLSNLRVFDLAGNELASDTLAVDYTTDFARTVIVGFSSGSNSNYNPNVAGSGDSGIIGNYNASIAVTSDLRVIQNGAALQITGGIAASAGADGLITVAGTPGTTGLPVVVNASMTSGEVALAIQRAVANQFSGGLVSAYPVNGNQVSLVGLTVQNNGPFAMTGVSSGDFFGNNGPQRARANNFEGVYVDDFIIGFAERGEMAFSATSANNFIADPLLPVGGPARPVSGSYQLEIRDGSEYINSLEGQAFRGFDTNDRLASGLVIQALPAGQIVDGATFRITDGVSTVTFEMDLVNADGTSNGVTGGRVRIPLITPANILPGRDGSEEVAAAIAVAINSPQVRGLIDVTAVATDGVDTRGNSRLNLFGDIVVLDSARVLASVTALANRGDQNRDRTGQGVIIVENSRFSFSANSGIEITRDARARVQGVNLDDQTPTVLTYPRNLVELNSQNQIPGVVVQSNVMAYNANSGVTITGLAGGTAIGNPVGFDRIINNTIVGGVIQRGTPAEAGVFGGVLFPGGNISFADSVVAFNPGTGVSPGFNNPNRALGAPDGTGPGDEPLDGAFTTSLGSGGSLTLGFADNFLTGSGDARPDLIVFETGEVESVRVEISRDGVTFFNVGFVGGVSNTVNIDQFGFGPQDRFSFVRLTDLRQGSRTSGPVGADIDAVGALSTAPADIYVPGGQGLVVRQNAAPTLLNNLLANNQSALAIDPTSLQTVVGATTYYRNATNAINSQANALGLFNQVLPFSLELFVDPANLSFAPRAGVPIIDSSIDSVEDRAPLVTVKNAIGLPPSPIIAPRLDVNGQLRVDDPTVQSPSGIGERVFKDRGAEERADQFGPRAILIAPRAADLGASAGQAETRGTIFDSFDIQLIDGIGPVDPTPGVGIFDASVTADSVLLTKNGVPLVEGRDYRFGYDASNNVIRLTPTAGIWEDGAVYVVRLLDATDSVLRFGDGASIADNATTTLLTSTGQFVTFESETGITATIDLTPTLGAFDGQGFTIFDGTFSLSFELDNDGIVRGDSIVVPLVSTSTPTQIAAALAAAINQTALNVTAASVGNRLQLLGPSSLATMTSLLETPTIFTISGQMGTSVGFGIGVPSENGFLAPTIFDGQTFRILRGINLVRTFELDFGNGILTPGAIPVNVGQNPGIDSIAAELVRAIGGAGLGLDPQNLGQGRISLGGDSNYALDMSLTALVQLGAPGQAPTVPVIIPIDATVEEVIGLYNNAIIGQSLAGVSFGIVGDRLILDGVAAISGLGAVASPVIRDTVGNLLQSNRDNGRTELTVFVGGGFNFGNAPAPYPSLLADNGPRHRVDTRFSFGPTVGPDADAVIPGGSTNDGIALIGNASPGFPSQFTIDVRADGRAFYVDAWIDWDRDGVFEATEVTRFKSAGAAGAFPILGVGVNTVSINVPAGTTAGPTWGRFRLSEIPGLGPVGAAESGEVEDIAILVQSNPYQNPLNRFDVNKSGLATPLDALNILNLLAAYSQTVGATTIPLNPPPASLPDLVNQRFLPDVDGNGRVESLDALLVLTELRRLQISQALAEGEAASDVPSGYVAVADGVLASPLTIATAPVESREDNVSETAPVSITTTATVYGPSIFDSPELIGLDDVIQDIAGEERQNGDGANDSLDAVFAGLGLGL
ncbi:MAG TPA: hypothetical protein DDZ51_01915 [Planctomycetaceae bacterium]|nr:hypothetical protein [Planctomycetaceae bacterium]